MNIVALEILFGQISAIQLAVLPLRHVHNQRSYIHKTQGLTAITKIHHLRPLSSSCHLYSEKEPGVHTSQRSRKTRE